MSRLGWLTARPIAHRGLHDAANGVIENTPSAVLAALPRYGVEVDLQVSADGEAMVHHDDALGRLTDGEGLLKAKPAAELKRVPFKGTADRMITLGELCDLVAGRAALVLELKTRFDGDLRLAERCAAVLANYRGPVAAMSFDPALVATLRRLAPRLARGILAEWRFVHPVWRRLDPRQKRRLRLFLHAASTRPDFVGYGVQDLASPASFLARRVFALPLLAWTVRTHEERQRAARYADQMIFEGFTP
jgi:glycerophosphoryl diester phosphodiesterase